MGSLLSLRDVSKSYWRGSHETAVLNGLCLDVQAGELVAIWGRRGSGKTTLLKIAAGLEAPDGGKVRFDGNDLHEHRGGLAHVLHSGLGWAQRNGPQSDGLSTIDYVALPLLSRCSPRDARREAATVLARVGARDCAQHPWEELTDTERTLVAIAHALVRRPRLLIVDDPTAHLDMFEREEVMSLLRGATEQDGIGVLVTVPDMPEMIHAHQVGSLSEGRLVLAHEREPEANVIEFPAREKSA